MKNLLKTFLLLTVIIGLSGCTNLQVIDTTWHYDRVIIQLPNGEVVEGIVESWKDYADSDMIQVKVDGVSYLTHSTNVVLIDD